METASIIAISSVHRRFRAAAPWIIGIPLTLAIPIAGVFLGLRLADNPRFAAGRGPLIDTAVAAGFFLLTAFFTCVRWFGILGALAIWGFVVLAIFLLCARLVGANVLALFRREP